MHREGSPCSRRPSSNNQKRARHRKIGKHHDEETHLACRHGRHYRIERRGEWLVTCAFRRGTDEVRPRGGRPRHARRETGHEHRLDQHAPERLAARRPHHRGKLRRLRRVRGAARHRHHGIHRGSPVVSHPAQPQAHRAHRVTAPHGERLHRREAQPVPKRAVRNRRRRARRVDRVRRHRHRGNPRTQAAHHELQRLHQRELPAARLYPHRPHRALRPFRACKEGGRVTRSHSRSPRRVRQARPASVRAETHARTRFADLLGFGAVL